MFHSSMACLRYSVSLLLDYHSRNGLDVMRDHVSVTGGGGAKSAHLKKRSGPNVDS